MLQVVKEAQVLSEVEVAGICSNWTPVMHTVSVAQTVSEVVVAAAVWYCVAEQVE
jgi:hypothetical protein